MPCSNRSWGRRWNNTLAIVLACGAIPACSQSKEAASTAPPAAAAPKPPAITQSTFEPVYRAAKSVQGATAAGVTYVKFGELLQGFSTEISIAADHALNESDKKLLQLYRDAYDHYQISDQLWKLKNDANDDMWKGEIPFDFGKRGGANPVAVRAVSLYKLPVYDRALRYGGQKYKAIPGDSVQRAWVAADAALQQATDVYYGRPPEKKQE